MSAALVLTALFTVIAPKEVAAEQQPDCVTIQITSPDGTQSGYCVVCNDEDFRFYLEHYCHIKLETEK